MEWLDRGTELELQEDPRPRSRHLPHVTEIIHDMERTLYQERVERRQSSQDRQEALRQFEKGYVFEQVLRLGLMARMLGRGPDDLLGHDEEIEKDGILLNPDDINLVENELEEYKASARSMRRFEEEDAETNFWGWFQQIKNYCHVKRITRARLVVLWICGDYRPPFPHIRSYQVQFDKRELAEAWEATVNHKRYMESEGRL
jgi:hypothetical protein